MVREYPPYNFPYAGDVDDGSLGFVGSWGHYWLRTAYSTNGTYALYFNSRNVNPASDDNVRYDGYPIRCVATT